MLINPTGGPEDEVRDWNDEQTQRWGYLPNYAAAFASRPDVARAWTALNAAVRDGMDRRRFELATLAAALELRSTYCTIAHSKFLRDVCGDETAMMSLLDPDARDARRDRPGRRRVRAKGRWRRGVDLRSRCGVAPRRRTL